jgi:hypothetical protein
LAEPLTLAEAIQDLLPHELIAFCACCYCVSLDEANPAIRDRAGSLKILFNVTVKMRRRRSIRGVYARNR